MDLTYRGCSYNKDMESESNRRWWNLAHRPWLYLTYRGNRYEPYKTGGQVNWSN